ncbi:hypothetical protein BLOT_009789, partial [Blomia tropicalis]
MQENGINSNNEYFIESKNCGRHRRRRLMMIKNPLWSLLIRTENLLTIIFFVQMLTNLSKIVATDEEGIYEWEPDQYPHIRKQGKFCTGSHRNPPTSVCDPDTVLTRDEANELDTLIDNGRNSTLHQCLCEPCDINEAGLAIKIAVVMSVKYKGKNQTLEETLEHFADRVRTNWNVSPKCHHDVLVLVATGYNKVYISMGSKAERAISRSEAKEIIKETLDHFKYGNTYQGLESIVASIISVSDRYDPRLDRFGLRHGLLVTIVGALASLL